MQTAPTAKGLTFKRFFTAGDDQRRPSPVDAIEWEQRESKVLEPDGTIVFEFAAVEVPKDWSQLATDI